MGTSSMYKGPSDKKLLPDDYNSHDNLAEEKKENSNPNKDWKNAKNAVSKYINTSRSTPSKSFSRYSKASGGSSNMSKTSTSGIKGVSRLGGFLNSVRSEGIQNTFDRYNIDYQGKSAKIVLAKLADKLCDSDDTKEEAVGKTAMCKTLQELYEMIEKDGQDNLEYLEKMDDLKFNLIVNKYIENYIFTKFMKDFQYRFERSKLNNSDTVAKEKEIKNFIKNSVSRATSGIDLSKFDFKNSNNIQKIYEKCYKVWEE